MDIEVVERWIAERVGPIGPVEVASSEPWASVLRVPTTEQVVWFKACEPRWRFEARLTSELSRRWSDLVVEVLAHDERRGWLLLADAGTPISTIGNPPDAWLAVLPRYAELQRGECRQAVDHLACGVPDLRAVVLPGQYEQLLHSSLPIDAHEIARLRAFGPRFEQLCADLAAAGIPDTVQHDDLHHHNLYRHDGRFRVLDWGDASISHPFASLVVTFRFLEEVNGLTSNDAWFARLRDAYLEPWGHDLTGLFELAIRVGAVAHAIASFRQRQAIASAARDAFDTDYRTVLRRCLASTIE